MTDFIQYEVGKPWPYPLGAPMGMRLALEAGEEAPRAMLTAWMPQPTRPERQAMRKGRLKLGVLPSPPLVWIVAQAEAGLSFDAPYGLGLAGPAEAAAVLASVARSEGWSPQSRNLIDMPLVDSASGLLAGFRSITTTRAWWMAFAGALKACPLSLSIAERNAAMARDYARWPATADMLAACVMLEVAGI